MESRVAFSRRINSEEPPKTAGVSVLFTTSPPLYVFINTLKDVRARLIAWEFHFRNCHKPDYYPTVARFVPDIPPEKWTYRWYTDQTAEKLAEAFTRQGYNVLSSGSRSMRLTYKGKTGTLAQLCREFGIEYNQAYYKFAKRKFTLAQIFEGDPA